MKASENQLRMSKIDRYSRRVARTVIALLVLFFSGGVWAQPAGA
jgi:hypothetical protein